MFNTFCSNTVISDSSKNLGLEESNVALDNPEDMSVNDPIPDNETAVDHLSQPSPENSSDQKDVGPDDETSLDQQDEQSKETRTLDEEELDRKTSTDKEDTSKDEAMNSSSKEEEQIGKEHSEEESNPEEDVPAEKNDDDGISKEDEPSHETDLDEEVFSEHSSENEKQTSGKPDLEKYVHGNEGDKDMVNVDDLVSNDNSLA